MLCNSSECASNSCEYTSATSKFSLLRPLLMCSKHCLSWLLFVSWLFVVSLNCVVVILAGTRIASVCGTRERLLRTASQFHEIGLSRLAEFTRSGMGNIANGMSCTHVGHCLRGRRCSSSHYRTLPAYTNLHHNTVLASALWHASLQYCLGGMDRRAVERSTGMV